jgi:hypothetical protein
MSLASTPKRRSMDERDAEDREKKNGAGRKGWRRLRVDWPCVWFLSSGDGNDLGARARRDGQDGLRLQLERIVSGGNHHQRYGAIGSSMEILGFKPGTEPGIVDFRLPLPEVWFEAALNTKVAELEFDVMGVFGKIAADIRGADVQPRDAMAFALSFHHHKAPVLGYPVRVQG